MNLPLIVVHGVAYRNDLMLRLNQLKNCIHRSTSLRHKQNQSNSWFIVSLLFECLAFLTCFKTVNSQSKRLNHWSWSRLKWTERTKHWTIVNHHYSLSFFFFLFFFCVKCLKFIQEITLSSESFVPAEILCIFRDVFSLLISRLLLFGKKSK